MTASTIPLYFSHQERGYATASQDDSFAKLEPDPGWKVQVEALSLITSLLINRILERTSFCASKTQRPARCLQDLREAMSRQQVHLDSIGSRQTTEFKEIYDFDRTVCRKCGTPYSSRNRPAEGSESQSQRNPLLESQ